VSSVDRLLLTLSLGLPVKEKATLARLLIEELGVYIVTGLDCNTGELLPTHVRTPDGKEKNFGFRISDCGFEKQV
jgi:hypothetical protein